MPGMNGVDLRNHVQVASPELAARFVFIDKPVDLGTLSELIRRLAAGGGDGVDTAVGSR